MRPLLLLGALLGAALMAVLFGGPALAGSFGGTAPPGGDSCSGLPCSVQSLTSSGTVASTAPSGQYALQVTTAGAKVAMGPGLNQHLACPNAAECMTDSPMRFGGGADVFVIGDSRSGAVRANSANGLAILVQGTTEPTCSNEFVLSGPTRKVGPGTVFTMLGATGRPTRFCACTYDGTEYRWYNALSAWDATGTATTCPTGALPRAQVFVNQMGPSSSLNAGAAVPGARIGDHITCTLVSTPPAEVVSIPSGVVVGQCFVGTNGQVVIAFENTSTAFTVQPFSVTFSFQVTRP